MRASFEALSDYAMTRAGAGEELILWFQGEDSDFVRFNRGRVRQPGSVSQRGVSIRLIRGDRHASSSVTLSDQKLGSDPLVRGGSDELQKQLLTAIAAGDHLIAFALTEAGAGSDILSMQTAAVPGDGHYVLNGRKLFITNGSVADVATVWARTEDGSINGFLVEKDMPGFEAPEMKHKLSLRASVTSELVLDGVRLPAAAMLPEPLGLRGPLSCLNEARYGIVWGSIGAARA